MEDPPGSSSSSGEDEYRDAADDRMVVTLTCPVPNCNTGTNGVAWSYTGEAQPAAVYLDYHIKSHAAPAAAATERRPRPPSLQPPKLAAQCSEARFAEFERAWGFYKQSVDMPAGATTSYLLSCCDEDLRSDVQAATQDILTKDEDEVMAAIKRYAVQQRAQCSIKMELMAMVQDHGEGVRKFFARVQNVARQCKLTVPCQNDTCRLRLAPFTSYNDEIVKLVVLNGIADTAVSYTHLTLPTICSV